MKVMAAFHSAFRTLALISCAVLAHAQATGEPGRLVRLKVTAVESNGQPASGLAADDFQIIDQGKPQKVALIRGAAQMGGTASREYSNRPAPGSHTSIILFDFLATSRAERLDASRKLGVSLKQLPSGESVYLYVLAPDGKIVPLHEMPKDPGSAPDKMWNSEAEKMLAGVVKSQNKDRPMGMSQEDVVKKTYVALETLANQLSAFPGRKDIVWITTAVPYVMNPQIECKADWWDCTLYVPHLMVTLEYAGVTVDPFSYISLAVDASRTADDFAGLNGGSSYLNRDLADVLKEFGSQAGTYAIAYAPAADNWDSKFHRVKVTCERKGVKLQARQHYYALPDQRPADARRQGLMVAAYQSSSDVSDIGLRAAAVPAGAPNTLRIEVRVDPADLLLQQDAGQYSGRVTLLLSARAASGPQGEPTLSDVDVHLTREQYNAALKDGVLISKDYPIDSATQKVRLIVSDLRTDSIGSLTIPVTPAPAQK